MAMILRTRPTPVQKAAAEVVTPIRRLRLTSHNTAASRAALQAPLKLQIDEELKSIAKAERAIDEATVKIDASYAKIDSLMRSINLHEHTNGVHVAEIVEQWTKQQRVIDPMKFKNAVPNKLFWKAVSVNIAKAGDYLTEKEINDIADITPGKKTGDVLKIKRLPIKMRTK